MVADLSGNLVGIRRHDYLPFGEELLAGTGGRTTGQGYAGDNVRQQFTGYERDVETGLDYAQARYFSASQGRFTSPDPLSHWVLKDKEQTQYLANPQRFNKYVYVLNNPLRNVDPNGLAEIPVWGELSEGLRKDLIKRLGSDAEKKWNGWSNNQRQDVINARANLIAAGIWDNVTSLDFSQFKVSQELNNPARGRAPASYSQKVDFWIDNSQSGWRLALTTDKDVTDSLRQQGYRSQSSGHPEGKWQLKGSGDDIVLHFVGMKDPNGRFTQIHWDGGGGRVSLTHAREVLNNKNPTPDDVSRHLGKNPASAPHLRGISNSMDKLLTQ
jgi:RHS repeat-associated protein